jgi:hypothetical protein
LKNQPLNSGKLIEGDLTNIFKKEQVQAFLKRATEMQSEPLAFSTKPLSLLKTRSFRLLRKMTFLRKKIHWRPLVICLSEGTKAERQTGLDKSGNSS